MMKVLLVQNTRASFAKWTISDSDASLELFVNPSGDMVKAQFVHEVLLL